MKLWIISQKVNSGYDSYDSAVVAAETEEEARNILPTGNDWSYARKTKAWANNPSEVNVEYLGETNRQIHGIIVSSFNAG